MAWMPNKSSGALVFAILGAMCWGVPPAAASASGFPAFTRMDTLFLTAATGEPRFQSERNEAERTLVAGDSATLDWLVTGAKNDLTPRQRHYVERLFTVIADSGRNPAARRVLARALDSAPDDTVRAQWLYIGSRLGDTSFRDVAVPWLASGGEGVRRMAVRVLGACPRAENLPLLWTGLDTLRGLERHQRLWALDAHSPLREPAWRRLAPLLADGQRFNRRKARDMLLKATDSSWVKLRALMPQNPDAALRREWWLLALDAQGGGTFLEAERNRMTGEERRFFGVTRESRIEKTRSE
jgi:hypothetical protein